MRRKRNRSMDFAPAVILRSIPSMAVAFGCLYLASESFGDLTMATVSAAIGAISPGALLLATICAALSLLTLSFYDVISFPVVNTRSRYDLHAPWPRLMRGGFAGSIFAQSLGFGVLTGAYARSRIYAANDVKAFRAGVMSMASALGFIAGGVAFTALALIVAPQAVAEPLGLSTQGVRIICFSALTTVVGLAALRAGPRRGVGATMRSLGLFSLCSAMDLTFASLAFAALLPAEALPDMATFIAIFAAATVVGHLSSSPSGVGPFDAMMIACLPAAPAEAMVAALVLYRVLYYLVPMIPATLLVVLARPAPATALAQGEDLYDRVQWAIDASDNPEAELAMAGDKRIYQPHSLSGFIMYGVSGRIWLVLGDPVAPLWEWRSLIDGLSEEAEAAGATLAIYKATEAAAPLWRERRMILAPLGEEASIAVQDFSLEGSDHREIRRKIRSAVAAGVEIRRHEPGEAPLDALADVADQWTIDRNGPELSFSMGAWKPEFVNRHMVFSAWVGDDPVAFVSCWRAGDGSEWMLDLTRRSGGAPDGSVHFLIAKAVEAAAESGAQTLNLSMAPLSGLAERSGLGALIGDYIYRRYGAKHGLQGMRRFKSAFRPVWKTRYIAAPSALALAEAVIAARRLVLGQGEVDKEMSRAPLLSPPAHAPRSLWVRPEAPSAAEHRPADERIEGVEPSERRRSA